MKETMKHQAIWVLVHLPGFLFLAVAVIGLIPSVSEFHFIQDHIPGIAKVVLALVGLLLIIAPSRVWQIASISVAEANMKLTEKSLKERQRKVTVLEQLYNNAEQAINAGNVSFWLDSRIVQFHWCGLKEQYVPYIVAKIEVASRFPFDLLFIDVKHVKIRLTLDGETIVQEAMLTDSQLQWQNPEEARESHWPIKAVVKNDLYLRFEIRNPDVKKMLIEFHKDQKEINCGLFLDWKLKTSQWDKEVSYTPPQISGRFSVTLNW